jgi:IMP dehydrogenase/GMP reductase
MKDIKFDLNDIVIIPAEGSDVNSRTECNVFTEFNLDKFLPIITAPMDTVVSPDNFKVFLHNDILPCLPRVVDKSNVPIDKRYYFQSFGLCEIEKHLRYEFECGDIDLKNNLLYAFWEYPNVLIDIANGHMNKLIPIIKEIKRKFPDITLMVGNIANPETFANLGLAGADFIRCSIGTGAGCTTAANVSINYPMGSLIEECRKQKRELGLNTKIVADGGMKNYSDIIKALALGADYVMMGSTFNKSIESAGFNYLYGIKIPQKTAEALWRWGFPVKKKYRGMSTKAVQRSWGKSELVTAEGITKYQKVEYTLDQWTENFKDYLKSAMSYCGAKKLDDFIGNAQYVFITDAARRRFDK